ncbi:MAG: protein kinase [Chloroflexota bacterium]|nr:protein kinase [Chloroflexota bacterium]
MREKHDTRPLPKLHSLVNKEIRGFRFDALVAQGGFGQVYRATRSLVNLDQQVAIKVILPQYANQPSFVRRFELEAQFVAQLEHPHVVPLYDYWRDSTGAYLVMRYLRGGSLTDLLDRSSGPLPMDLIARMLDQIAAALTTAHRAGIIHRDMKPANVLLDEDKNAYLADFGIAKRIFEDDDPEFERFGSPAYVAPEIIANDVLTAQTDIYSLGIILYEMLTGALPFEAPSQTLVLQKHLTAEVPSLKGLRPDLPEEANYVIRRATQRQPKDRYADALAMAQDFRRLVQSPLDTKEMERLEATPSRPRRANESADGTMILNIAAIAQKNPYKGLRPFQESDAVDFFGREAVLNRLIKRMRSGGVQSRCIVLVGPSGSGKSSLARAGLLPALRRGAVPGANKWFYAVMTPGSLPFVELEETLGRISIKPPTGLANALRQNPNRIHELLDNLMPPNSEFVLLIDQFEEVFSLTSDADERDALLNALFALVQDPRARLIVTLRADFYDRPLLHPRFGDLARECTEVVLPLSSTEMEAAITKPAERLGVAFEPGLTNRIMQDVSSQPGSLPLLQYVLTELFDQRANDILTMRSYEAEGGVFGALARRAEEVYRDLDENGQEIAQRLFMRLINVGETDDTRRRILQTEAHRLNDDRQVVESVLEKFGRYRLLTFDRDSVTREPTVEIAHEALIRHWARLRDWIDSNRVQLRLHQQLTLAAADWEQAGRDNGFLARGGRLATFETLTDADVVTITETEQAYLDASLVERGREQMRTRQRLIVVAIIALLATAAAVFAIMQRDSAVRSEQVALNAQSEAERQTQLAQQETERANRAANIARADRLATIAAFNPENPDFSILLSLEALRLSQTTATRGSLLEILDSSPNLLTFLHGSQAPLRSVAVSPDGLWAAAGARSGDLYVWRLDDTHQPPILLSGHQAAVNSVAFSPDSRVLASGAADATLRLWDMETQTQIGEPLEGHQGPVWDVAFSPDGALLASSGEGGEIRLWTVETRRPRGRPLISHDGIVFTVAFHPDGTTLASGGDDGYLHLWDVETGRPLGEPIEGHPNWIADMMYSPDGGLLATSDFSGYVLFWNVAEGYIFEYDDGRQDFITVEAESPLDRPVRALAFSPDSRTLAVANGDTRIQLFDMTTRQVIGVPLLGHRDDVWGLAFRDATTFVSAAADGRTVLWDTRPQLRVGRMVSASLPMTGLVMNSARTLLAAGSVDPGGGIIAQVWDINGERLHALQGVGGSAPAVAFVPNTDTLLAVDDSPSLVRWNLTAPDPAYTLLANLPSIPFALVVSPDGRWAAVSGADTNILVFDLNGTSIPLAATLTTTAPAVRTLAFTRDGTYLISGDDNGQITYWSSASWQQDGAAIDVSSGDPNNNVTAIGLSPAGRLLGIGRSDGSVWVYDVETRQPVRQPVYVFDDPINFVSFRSEVVFASAASEAGFAPIQDYAVRLWSIEEGEAESYVGHTYWAMGAQFLSDGITMATVGAGSQGRLILWDLRRDLSWNARAVGCNIANRNLTQEEWERYFGDEEYRETCSFDEESE